jgi:predicted adenylyl cyclase CyaB
MELTRAPLADRVELKARIDDLEAAAEACRRLGAVDRGAVDQTDTYFSLGAYRLKLRESSDGHDCLIGCSRPATPGARKSQYRLQRVENPGAARAALARQWGVKAIVKVKRRWFLWEGRVRIHLDRVAALGDFLEFEADLDAASGYDEDAARLDLARLSHDFGVEDRDLVSESYATLIKNTQTTPSGT